MKESDVGDNQSVLSSFRGNVLLDDPVVMGWGAAEASSRVAESIIL